MTFDRFDRIDDRLDELTSHFETIQDQLHVLCEIISSNNMQVIPTVNGGNVACESSLHFDQNDDPKCCFNEKVSVSQDNILGTKFES